MTAVAIPGAGFVHPHFADASIVGAAAFQATGPIIDATGEKVAAVGRVYWADRGTHDIRKVGWHAGAIVSAGGSGITISLQDPDTATGGPSRPDGTQDQTVGALLSALTPDAWNEHTLSADRVGVAHSTPLAVVWEYDGAGRLGADSLEVDIIASGARQVPGVVAALLTASWATQTGVPAMVLVAADGTIGTLGRSIPAASFTTHAFNSGSTPDEIANQVKYPVPVTLEGVELLMNTSEGADFSVILYDGVTALETLSLDEDTAPVGTVGETKWRTLLFSTPRALAKDTLYRVAIRADAGGAANVVLYSINVNTAAYLDVLAGQDFHYWDRTDAGAWSNENTTRWILMRLLLSQADNAAGGAGGLMTHPGTSGGLRG